MRFLYLLVLGSVSTVDFGEDTEWETFKSRFRKKYDDLTDERERRQIYMKNKAAVAKHNARYAAGLETYQMSINKFADMKPEEVKRTHGYIQSEDTQRLPAVSIVKSTKIPSSFDWRERGAVTDVKDEDTCGACWAIGAVGSIESHVFLATNYLASLSVQELIDCSTHPEGNVGCVGGTIRDSFKYVISNGLTTEECYPYTKKEGKCLEVNCWKARLASYVELPRGDEDELLKTVATIGPVSVALNTPESFEFYAGGIYEDEKCRSSPNALNHAALVVGYGSSKTGQLYWLVKNGWGPDWGDSGYVRMARNKSNQCGIATTASYPVVSSNLTSFSAPDRSAMHFVYVFASVLQVFLHGR